MRVAPASAWAPATAGTAVAGIAVTFVGSLLHPSAEGRIEALWVLSWVGLGLPIVGALVVARRPDNRVGWLLLGIGVGIGVGLLAETYAAVVGVRPDGGVLLALWWVVDTVGFSLAFGLIPLLLLCFPDGRSGGPPGGLRGPSSCSSP